MCYAHLHFLLYTTVASYANIVCDFENVFWPFIPACPSDALKPFSAESRTLLQLQHPQALTTHTHQLLNLIIGDGHPLHFQVPDGSVILCDHIHPRSGICSPTLRMWDKREVNDSGFPFDGDGTRIGKPWYKCGRPDSVTVWHQHHLPCDPLQIV